MKTMVLGNQARAMSNFWTVLITRMKEQGHDVVCLVPEPLPGDDPAWEEKLSALGARLVHFPFDRKGLNPLRDGKTLLALRRILKKERPDRLFAYTIKCVIYGAVAAALAGFPARAHRHLMITGLGYAFEADSFLKRVLLFVTRLLYRAALGLSGSVFFQNRDDAGLFAELGIIPQGLPVFFSRGTGVDTARFENAPPKLSPPVFLYVGRLLEAKGLKELCEAAALVKEKHPEAEFRLLGPAETGPGAMSMDLLRDWERKGVISLLGETRDVRPYLAEASVVVLPSRREGTPCSLMEAMSMGRPVVAANAPGSREVVRPDENGLLTPAGDAKALAQALESFIMNPERIAHFGAAGRRLAEAEFDAGVVADGIMRDMEKAEAGAKSGGQ